MNVSKINIKLLHVRKKSNVSKNKLLSKTIKFQIYYSLLQIEIVIASKWEEWFLSHSFTVPFVRETIQRLRYYLPFNGEQRRKQKRYRIRLTFHPHFGKYTKVVRSYIPQLISRPRWRIEWTDDITTNTRFIARSF